MLWVCRGGVVARTFIHLAKMYKAKQDNHHLASLSIRGEELNAEVELERITRSWPLLLVAWFSTRRS